jgi:hypothetical protein
MPLDRLRDNPTPEVPRLAWDIASLGSSCVGQMCGERLAYFGALKVRNGDCVPSR